MKESAYGKINLKDIQRLKKKVEENSDQIDEIVNGIIKPYCKNLDKYVKFISTCLNDGQNPPTTAELEDFCMNLSTRIYFASGLCERLGVRDDIGKAVYKEMYHTARSNQKGGTVNDKNSLAELASQQEYVISVCYTRAYKTLKAKVESAQEILSSCKKVLSHRMQEMELTKLGG